MASVIPFLAYIFLFPFLRNPDTYYYFFRACGEIELTSQPFLAEIFFDYLMPCNELLFKIVPFFLLLASTFVVILASRELYKGTPQEKHSHLAGLALFLTPIWISQHFMFEEDVFAYTGLALALYFFILAYKRKQWKYHLATIATLVASGLMWKGAFYSLLAIGTAHIYSAIVIIATLLSQVVTISNIVTPLLSWYWLPQVSENAPLLGFIMLLSLNLVFLKLHPKLKWPSIIMLIVAALNVKLAILAVPILALSFPRLIQAFELKQGKQKTAMLLTFFLLFATLLVGYSAVWMSVRSVPSVDTMQAAEETVIYSQDNDLNILNDWSYGYYIKYFGGTPSAMGHPDQINELAPNTAYLTIQDLNCNTVKEYYQTISGSKLTLYHC